MKAAERDEPGDLGDAAAVRPRRPLAAGIYGTIVTAAILSAAGGRLPVLDLAVSVLVTLTVYWIAEEYADLLGGQLVDGHLPTWPHVRAALALTWPMVTASCLPLLVLLLAGLAGAAPTDAANAGLAAAAVELVLYAWAAGRAAELRGRQQAIVTSTAAVLGLAMIALKDLVLTHLH